MNWEFSVQAVRGIKVEELAMKPMRMRI